MILPVTSCPQVGNHSHVWRADRKSQNENQSQSVQQTTYHRTLSLVSSVHSARNSKPQTNTPPSSFLFSAHSYTFLRFRKHRKTPRHDFVNVGFPDINLIQCVPVFQDKWLKTWMLGLLAISIMSLNSRRHLCRKGTVCQGQNPQQAESCDGALKAQFEHWCRLIVSSGRSHLCSLIPVVCLFCFSRGWIADFTCFNDKEKLDELKESCFFWVTQHEKW